MTSEIAQHIHKLQEIIGRLKIYVSNDKQEITQDYGYLKFDQDPLSPSTRLSQYIRLAHNTETASVDEFFEKGWCLPNPDLIITVAGGGKQFHMPPHLRKVFQYGLVVAATTTNAWLITAGTNTGVVKEVGEALNTYRYIHQKNGLDIPCIGIGSWKYIAGCEQLTSSTEKTLSTLNNPLNSTTKTSRLFFRNRTPTSQADVSDEDFVRSYVVTHLEDDRQDLEPNHTHFLLFDDGATSKTNLLSQRVELENYARLSNAANTETDSLIPTIMILVEGGCYSIRTVFQSLESSAPLVVIKDSGRAADLVADLYAYFCRIDAYDNENEQKNYPMNVICDDELESILEKTRASNNPWVDDIKDELCKVVRCRKDLITIFQFDSEQYHGLLEEAILDALFKAAKFILSNTDDRKIRLADLKLAMAWNKPDYARKHILSDTVISKWKGQDLCDALLDALRRDRVDFVELIIDYGAPIENLTGSNIEKLYEVVGRGLPIENEYEEGSSTRTDYYTSYFISQFSDCNDLKLDSSQPLGKHAINELFLWAVFHDRLNIAKYLCSKTWNQAMAPLIAAHIYMFASTMAVHSQTKERYIKMASDFDTFATAIIDKCFSNNAYFGVQLLQQPAVAFNNLIMLNVAQRASCQSFLASDCVQKYLDNKWFGNINYKRQIIHFRIFLCSIFFPLIPIFAVFLPYVHEHREIVRSSKSHQKDKTTSLVRTIIVSDRDPVDGFIPWSKKISFFYNAPIVRFYYNIIFFILFLTLYSFVLLLDYFPLNIYGEHRSNIRHLPIPITEMILHLCIWSLILEELRQFIITDAWDYFGQYWNWIDITAICLYFIGLTTRFSKREAIFTISKISLCLDLIVWFVATLRIFTAFERLGPKLLMILNTMRDLLFFLCFIIVFLFAFSITSWSLMNSVSQIHWAYNDDGSLINATITISGNNSWSWKLLKDITDFGVRKIFAQIDPIEGNDAYSNMAFILTIIFVTIANVLLLNVLIALFNVTIQNVQDRSHTVWRYQRFVIVHEYQTKTPLPPPFNILYYIFCLIRFVIKRIRHRRKQRRSSTTEILLNEIKTVDKPMHSQFTITDFMQRENAIATDYWYTILKFNRKDPTETALTNIERKIDSMKLRMETSNHVNTVSHREKQQINRESDV